MKFTRPILLVLAIAIIAAIAYRRSVPRQNVVPKRTGGQYDLEVHSIPVTHTLALGEFEIPAKSTHDVKIALDESRMQNARLSGYFSTAGPAIQLMLLDEIQYGRFQNHSTPSEYLYLSKAASSGNVEAPIPHPGTYYLVFDNSASDSSVKVKADVSIRWQTVQVDSGPSPKKQ